MIAFGSKTSAGRSGHFVERVDLTINARFAHPSRDQLRDLGAEIDDQDAVLHGGDVCLQAGQLKSSLVVWRFAGHGHVMDMAFAQARIGDADEAAIFAHGFDICVAGIAHGRFEAPYKLMDDIADRPFVRHLPFNAFRY